ncbi:T9SS type A sorting domain-containing protein [Dyadobacter chenwenxiniae]|uniref:T9SS type A sorting domain-containing protein n=1 Tax=Dyadobacter chenwenxiniae TaxID=2906456 RepID=A0A9X1PIP4_9BACT|nr:FG-GAP-like repeat-containing protein [Dyadobacter chenwenxiniae]MCF0061426.1 T9SS type A sorting domain-containing protein [Dyadobacter chenwenxiniae]UON81248.1 T9SS type A sorting domain-containing protein [Dyadobacter chenwenxiniae]
MRTKFTSFLLFIFSIVTLSNAFSQKSWFKIDTLTSVNSKGAKLTNPWAGGLNASQFLKMHLNNDADEDLVVYDRTNSKITTFLAAADPLNPGKKTFIHTPYYESLFPKADNWMILADYDGDGHKDLFTSTSLGVSVYRQVKTAQSWTFRQMQEVLYTKGFSGNINLQVSGTDIPGIVDVDDDGDLDLLLFDFSGNYIELHQNLSMEKFGKPDSLGSAQSPVFQRNGDCWGNFHKGANEGFDFGLDCGVTVKSGNREMHAGNSILLQDLNGDGKKDLLVGHVSNEHISFLTNSAAGLIGNFTAYTNTYPAVNPVLLHIFPAAFMEDVDFDGKKDLLIAPNVPSNDGNLTDFKSSGWFYRNAGTDTKPDFKLAKKNFLQDQMLDVGENAAPSFFDIDGDGDLDVLIGTGGIPGQTGFKGGFWLLKNTGNNTAPAYEVESENYLNLASAIAVYNIKPQWADFNGDGVADLGFAATSTTTLKLEYRYIPNKAPTGAAPQLNLADAVTIAMPAESQTGDSPHFYDVDGDGDLDLLVGKTQGNLYYYTNTSTSKQFTFKLESDAFAGVAISFEGRSPQLAVADFDLDGRADVITADHTGNIRLFHGAEWGKWTDRETSLVEQNGKASAPLFGNYLAVTAGDYNGDKKPDIAIGSNAGGLRLLTNIVPVTITANEPAAGPIVNVFPNPAARYLKIKSSKPATFDIVSVSGRKIVRDQKLNANIEQEIITELWPTGLYLIELKSGNSRVVRKVMVAN